MAFKDDITSLLENGKTSAEIAKMLSSALNEASSEYSKKRREEAEALKIVKEKTEYDNYIKQLRESASKITEAPVTVDKIADFFVYNMMIPEHPNMTTKELRSVQKTIKDSLEYIQRVWGNMTSLDAKRIRDWIMDL